MIIKSGIFWRPHLLNRAPNHHPELLHKFIICSMASGFDFLFLLFLLCQIFAKYICKFASANVSGADMAIFLPESTAYGTKSIVWPICRSRQMKRTITFPCAWWKNSSSIKLLKKTKQWEKLKYSAFAMLGFNFLPTFLASIEGKSLPFVFVWWFKTKQTRQTFSFSSDSEPSFTLAVCLLPKLPAKLVSPQ